MLEAGEATFFGIQSQRMIGVYNHLLRKVFRFHCHSQKVSQDPYGEWVRVFFFTPINEVGIWYKVGTYYRFKWGVISPL